MSQLTKMTSTFDRKYNRTRHRPMPSQGCRHLILSARRATISLLWFALAVALHPIPAALAAEETELPSPSISACKYASLRFSHVDDIFAGCSKDSDGDSAAGGMETDAHQEVGASGDEFSERLSDAYLRAAWEQTIMHGWDMAETIEAGEGLWSSMQVDSGGGDSAFVIGDHEYRDSEDDETMPSRSAISAAYPFLVCSRTDDDSSGYDNLRQILPTLGAVTSSVVVLSNQPKESCFIVSTTAAAARKVAVSRRDMTILPLTDVMKVDAGIIDDVCLDDRWSVPLAPMMDEPKDSTSTWERKIRVGLRPGLGGTTEKTIELAKNMLRDIQQMAREGNRQRRLLGEDIVNSDEPDREQVTAFGSVKDAFSVTAPDMIANVFGRALMEGETPAHVSYWSRALAEGIESDTGCSEMFEALSVEARVGNAGFDLLLNPLKGKNNFASNGASSAGNAACVCSLIAALSTHPNTLEVSTNRPIKLHNQLAQHIVQAGRPNQTPFFDVGLTGKNQIVSVSDTGLSTSHCYFRNSKNANDGGDIFNGNWDMSARKVVHYDNTYADDYDAYAGHGTHVAGTVAGVVLPGTKAYNPGTGVAKEARISFFDMAIGANTVYDPGAARLFSSFYNSGEGARIAIGSWGRNYQSRYSQDCQDVDAALSLHSDVLYVASSGNDGDSGSGPWRTVKNPADCKNTLAVGASQSYGKAIKQRDLGPNYMASFSARGPTADGRTKPDLVAPGYMINSAISDPTSPTNCAFAQWAGTSMAAPVVAGTAALIRQYFVEGWYPGGFRGSGDGFDPSGSLVKAVLMNGGQLMRGVQRVPNGQIAQSTEFYDNSQGMGAINLMASLPLFRHNHINALAVNNDEIMRRATHTFDLDVTKCPSGSQSFLSVTLTWYDPAPMSGCVNCLVNNLDLQVILPNGATQHPNGRSLPDQKNNAERVRLMTSQLGRYRVVVGASNLATQTQRYSLIATGCFNFDSNVPTQKNEESEFFLDSLWSGGLKSAGTMFGLVAKQDINITALDFHTTLKGSERYQYIEVYEKDGSHIGSEQNEAAWRTLSHNIPIECKGRGEATRVLLPSKIQMKRGETKSIYLTLKGIEELRYTGVVESMGSVFSENEDLQILVGSGNSYRFSDVYPQRMFNGRVIWEKISSADEPTNAPIAALNDNAPSGTGSNTANALPESQPEPESTSPPNLPSPELARTFLTTLWNGGIKNSGSMFGVVAKVNIVIDTIQINTPYTGMIHFEVFMIEGSFQGNERNSGAWSLIARMQIQGGGEGRPTTIPPEAFLQDVVVKRRSTVGIYVTMKYQPELRYSPVQERVGDIYVENSDIAILVGTGNDDNFGDFYPQRMTNVALGYKKINVEVGAGGTSQVLSSPAPTEPSNPTFTLPPTQMMTSANPTSQIFSLETTWDGGVKNHGAMFDIVTKTDIKVSAFLINTPSTDKIDFEIYSINGGHQGNEQMSAAWSLVASAQITGAGEGLPTAIGSKHFYEDITLLSRQMKGFYITMKNRTELRYTPVGNKVTGDVFNANFDLALLIGTGNTYPFGDFWTERVINLGVQYERVSESHAVDIASASTAGRPFASIDWDLTQSGVGNSFGWTTRNDGFIIRYSVEPSYICEGGTNSLAQSGQATTVISVSSPTQLYFNLRGQGEQFETGYEMMVLEIDGNVVAKATSEALSIECSAGPVVVTNEVPSPFFLGPGQHELTLSFTTGDGFDHILGVHYELELSFV